MLVLKKLIFAPFFLIVFAILIYQLNPLLKSYDFIFSLSLDSIIQLVVLAALTLLSSLLFILFTALAQDWKLVLPTGILASLIPLVFVNQTLGMILAVGILASLLIVYLGVENTLKKYLNFTPNSLFGPPIRQLGSLLILVVSLTYFLSISGVVQKEGFQIPDSLIETSLKLVPQPQSEKVDTTSQPQLTIPPEQIELLKQNPDLLKQSGLDHKILDTLAPQKQQQSTKPPQDLLADTLKQTIKDQLQTIIKPYLGFVPALLAVILFFLLQSITSILNLFISPLLWILFFVFEKTGFVKFTEEMRPVKKMVV